MDDSSDSLWGSVSIISFYALATRGRTAHFKIQKSYLLLAVLIYVVVWFSGKVAIIS
jgi:hypothetical protein